MKRRKNLTIDNKSAEEQNLEIDLAPMLALMVTLIPIMLLSTVFVRISLIETPLPQVVQKAIENDRSKKDREVSLVLQMNDRGFRMDVRVNGRTSQSHKIPKVNSDWDLEGLYEAAHRTKLQHPGVFRVDLNPSTSVKYEDIVKVMDKLRTIKKDHKKATITDSETQQKAETDVMFPDVNFANVVEG